MDDVIEHIDLDALYEEAMDYLNEEYPYWLTHVLNMGSPEWTTAIPTAAVALMKGERDVNKFHYLFNPDFAARMSAKHLAFVMSHETMHIALDHLSEAKDEHFDNPTKHNIATDCIINDWLASVGMEVLDGAMRGLDVVGFDCSTMTTAEVYDLIPDNDEENEKKADEGNEATGDHDWMDALSDALSEAISEDEELAKAIEDMSADKPFDFDDAEPCSLSAFDQGMDEREWAKDKGVSLKWAQLLEKIDPDMFKGKGLGRPPMASWHKPNNRFMGCYPQTILPVYDKRSNRRRRTDERPHVVMFIDASGSVTREQVRKFTNLALSVPLEKIELTLVAAATSAKELDVKNIQALGSGRLPSVGSGNGPVSGFYSGWGVCEYMAMQNWLYQALKSGRLKEYPKAVIAISDGESGLLRNQITDDEAARWTFLIDSYHSHAHSASWHESDTSRIFKKEQFHKLTDFT